jgi:phosphoribosylformylglycinamidine (FGAM) synthase-like enzyme
VYAIKGMGEACKKFDTPVTGGNVSFYNQSSDDNAVFPTPTIGMVGLLPKGSKHMTLNFKQAGDVIVMLGQTKNDLGCSHYLAHCLKVAQSPAPWFDLDQEYNMQQAVLKLIGGGLIQSAHDVSEGGLMTCLLESAFVGNLGFEMSQTANSRLDAFLFGEAQGRVVVSVNPAQLAAVESLLHSLNLSYEKLGKVTANGIKVNGADFGNTADFANIYENSLADSLA